MTYRSVSLKFLPLLAVLFPFQIFALTNNLALTPPMGWNDWNAYHCGISESIITNNADVIVAKGLKAAGYLYVDVDDGWASSRDSNGVIQAYSASGHFPHGIQWLTDYVHSRGLKLGIYTDNGTNTCSSCISTSINPVGKDPGSYQFEYVDAFTYAQWGADYLKDDNCNAFGEDGQAVYGRMSDGLMKSGRSILFCLCGGEAGNAKSFQSWSPTIGNYWRTTGDIGSTFASMISHIDPNSTSAFVAGPGRWNDPDMLEIGNGEFASNLTAAQTHFTMWCIMAAPLIMGNNVTTISAQTLQILTNAEAIAVDQDPAGEQGVLVGGIKDSAEVWSKALGYDFTARAVVLLNRDTNNSATITCNWTNLALQNGPATVRDLVTHQDLGTFTDSFTATIPPYGSMLLKIVGTPLPPPVAGTNFLSDRQPIYAYTGFGTITKDKSVNGKTLTIGGVIFPKGIGVNSRSGVEYDLGGVCSHFQATIGVDDEEITKSTVIFQVFADGMEIYNSGVMTPNSPSQNIDLDVTGVRRLVLGVGDADDGTTNDHGDWGNALVTVTNTTPQPPHAPTGLTASPGNQINLTWNATVAATNYNVKRATVSGGTYTTITNVPIAVFTDSNVASGTTYFYVVSAVSSIGESSNSVEVSVTSCNVPLPPTNLIATVTSIASNSAVALEWNAADGATSYNISRFTGSTPPVAIASVVTTSFTDTNVVQGTTYYYLVTTANACNQSGNSLFAAAALQSINPSTSPVWNGGSMTSSNWSDAANWNGGSIAPGNNLIFDGANRPENNNDTAANTLYSGITFNPTADAFVLNGNPICLAGSIANNSPNLQVLNFGLSFSNNIVFGGTSNTLVIAAGLTNTLGASGSTTLTLAGGGLLNNLLKSANNPGGTNIIAMNDANANWSLVDNSSSAPMTVPWVFSINSGTFNFGSSASAPILTTTTPNNSPSDNQVGTLSGTTGTFNMLGGTLTTGARLNTATALNSTGIVNQVGGTMNIGSQFQGANGGNAGEVSIVNISGGTMNIGSAANPTSPFFVASRGGGTLIVSGSSALNCGTLDVSRNASGNSIGSVGVVNLNGGMILCSKVGTATANSQAGLNGISAAFNFNGGTLKINSSTPPFFQGSTIAPVIPISAVVKSGGAIIDSNGKTNIFAEPLLHDDALGSALDGGLTKNGLGSLILVSNVSCTGSTTVNAGILALSNSVALNSTPVIAVAAGAMLDASGRGDATLSLIGGQKLTGNGNVKGNVVIGGGATFAPGNSIGTMTFANNLMLNGGSTTVIEINKSASPSNDVAQISGNLFYGGTLVITNFGTNMFSAGDSFKLFNATIYNGMFTNITPAIPAVNLAWNTNGLTNGILSIISAPTPTPRFRAMNMNGNNFVFNGTNGVPKWAYYVLASTNLILPIDQWQHVATNFFDGAGNFNFTNSLDQNASQEFYLLQLP
jgi:alpha-galactosidase